MIPSINAILDGSEKRCNQLLLSIIEPFLIHSLFWTCPNSDRDMRSNYIPLLSQNTLCTCLYRAPSCIRSVDRMLPEVRLQYPLVEEELRDTAVGEVQ